jgi:hypothetical protein
VKSLRRPLALTLAALAAAATGAATLSSCALDWPPPVEPGAGAPDAGDDATDGDVPSDCERCPAVAAFARPDAPAAGATHQVPAGGDLQAALEAAEPGDEILLEPGGVYSGGLTLPLKDGEAFITVRSAAPASSLPGPCTRIGPAQFAALPKIVAPPGKPALLAADGAHHYRFVAVELTISPSTPLPQGVVVIGLGSETDATLFPHDIELDRVWIHGDPRGPSRHGLVANGASTRLVNSWISDIKNEGDAMCAVEGWNGPGPLIVVNSHLESAGTTVRLGDQPPSIAGTVLGDVLVGWSDLVRPRAWDPEDPTWDGSAWRTGSAVDLVNARAVTIEGNRIDHVWQAHAFRLEPRPDTGEPWGLVQDVTIAANEVGDVAAGFLIRAGTAGDASRRTRRVTVRDNLLPSLGEGGGEGRIFAIIGGIDDLVITHNTILQTDHICYADAISDGFVFEDNIVNHGAYGIYCERFGVGTGCLEALFPGYQVRRNVIVGIRGGYSPSDYPPDNFFPAYEVGFVDPAGGDYRLDEGTPYQGKATDGADVGVRFELHDTAAACRSAQ